jgi:hypothetical protein
MLLARQTLDVLEVQPTDYATLAANETEEVEETASINILQISAIGSFVRLYLGREQRDIMASFQAILACMESASEMFQDRQKKMNNYLH